MYNTESLVGNFQSSLWIFKNYYWRPFLSRMVLGGWRWYCLYLSKTIDFKIKNWNLKKFIILIVLLLLVIVCSFTGLINLFSFFRNSLESELTLHTLLIWKIILIHWVHVYISWSVWWLRFSLSSYSPFHTVAIDQINQETLCKYLSLFTY